MLNSRQESQIPSKKQIILNFVKGTQGVSGGVQKSRI